jgi:hypothetical protein
MDVPLVEKSRQNTPSFSSEIMAGLAKWKKPKERMLFVLCGAAGFRISEALGIEIDKHISSDFRTISVRQQARHCKVKTRLKTTNAVRDVDIHPAIASLLKALSLNASLDSCSHLATGNHSLHRTSSVAICTRLSRNSTTLIPTLERTRLGTMPFGATGTRICETTRSALKVCTSIGWGMPGRI